MKKPSEPPKPGGDWDKLRKGVLGLGDESGRRSYYPEFKERLEDLERFRFLLDHSQDAILLLETPAGVVRDANLAAERIFGLPRLELLSSPITSLICPVGKAAVKALLDGSPEHHHATFETQSILTNPPLPLEINLTIESFGRSYGVVLARDISERKKREQELEEQRARLAMAQNIARLGSWTWDLENNQVHHSAESLSILGLDAKQKGLHPWDLIHPQDEELNRIALEKALKRVEEYNVQYRIQPPKGGERHLHSMGRVEFNPQGKAIRFFGTLQDLTGLRNTEKWLLNLSRALEQSPVAVAITNLKNQVDYVNPRYLEMANQSLPEALGEPPFFFSSKRVGKALDASLAEAMQEKKPWQGDLELLQQGQEASLRLTLTPIKDHTKEFTHFLLVFEDVTKERQRSAYLQQAKEEAEKTSRAKSNFLATMSHELRTPMNGILGMADLLMHKELPPDINKNIKIIHRSSEALLSILNDILDLSKIEAGHRELVQKPFSIQEVVESNARLFRASAMAKGISVNSTIKPGIPAQVVGDQDCLNQVISNLVGNGVKFTQEGEVSIKAELESHQPNGVEVLFEVMDTGIGIPADQHERIFQAFTQIEDATTRKFGGTGLGLSIVKNLLDLMDSKIELVSHPGKGSIFRFRVSFPLVLAEAQTEPVGPAPTPMVMVVEDDPSNLDVMTNLLEHLGYRYQLARSGVEALGQLQKQDLPDLILMDLMMPGLDGLQTTQRIRQWERLTPGQKRLPIVALTAEALFMDREKCLQAGMDEFLTKPVSLRLLQQVLEQLCGKGG